MPKGVEYQILRADKKGCPPIEGLVFHDPAIAAKEARIRSKIMDEKLMVKPITNPQWKIRERMRFEDGTYRQMPWAEDRYNSWWHEAATKAVYANHFPHPSLERPGYLAYTKSAEDGTIDKQTIVRPGAYLNKYFGHIMNMYGLNERKLVEQFMIAYGPLEVKFATTQKEIVTLYENGVSTCMQGKDWPHDGRNPAWIYANGDLQVAYLGDLDDASARTLVWPEKKIFSRVYGDIARLTRGLERLGYKWGAPIGAKIHRVMLREVKFDPRKGHVHSCFLAPYIDKKNQAGGGHLGVIDKGDHLVICQDDTPGSHHCGLPHGATGMYVPREEEQPTFTCDCCLKPGIRELLTVLTEPGDDAEEQSWCPACTARHSFGCQYSGNRFLTADVEVVEVEGYHWAKYYADMYAVRCEATGELCHEDNTTAVYMADGKCKRVSNVWTDNQGGVFTSHFTGRPYLRNNRITVRGSDINRYSALPELKYHAFMCDDCQVRWAIGDRHQSNGDDKLFCPNCDEKLKYGPKAPPPKKSRSSMYATQAISSQIGWDVAQLNNIHGQIKGNF